MGLSAILWVGSVTSNAAPQFAVAGDTLPLKCGVVATAETGVTLTWYVNGAPAGDWTATIPGDGNQHVYQFGLSIPPDAAGQTYSVYARVNSVSSNTLRFPIIAGQIVPDGTVGVAAITLPLNEQTITLNSDAEGYTSYAYLHPKVYVVSKVNARRKCWVQFYEDTTAGMQFVVERPVGTDTNGAGVFVNEYETAILDLDGINVVDIKLREAGIRVSIFGSRELSADVRVAEYYGDEQPSEEACPATFCEFSVLDSSPNTPRVAFADVNIDPVTNRVGFILRNVGACKVAVNLLANHLITVDGQPIPARGMVDYGGISISMKPGMQSSFHGNASWWEFVPQVGRAYTICIRGDPTDTATVNDPERGGIITRPVVELTKY